MAPSGTVIADYALNGQMCSKAHTALTAPLVLHYIIQGFKMRNEKVRFQWPDAE
jgi:hypothetical protein